MNQQAQRQFEEEYLTPPESAKLRKCSMRTLEGERQRGDGPPYIKVRSQILYPSDELHDWLKAHLVTSTAEAEAREASRAKVRAFEEEQARREKNEEEEDEEADDET